MPLFCWPLKRNIRHQAGFTLIELAIVVSVIGVFTTAAIKFSIPLIEKAQRMETEEKMTQIARALNFYVIRNGRLPCAAGVDGAEDGNGVGSANGVDDACDAATGEVGLVPFITLGIPRDLAFDGYDNPIIYAVSPVFAQDMDLELDVHPRCRTREWYSQDGRLLNDVEHKNPRKARFCCPGVANFDDTTDLNVQNVDGNSVIRFALGWDADSDTVLTNDYGSVRSALRSATFTDLPPAAPVPTDNPARPLGSMCEIIQSSCNLEGGAGGPWNWDLNECCLGYNTIDRPFSLMANTIVPMSDRATAVAYVLVSQGKNGPGTAGGWEVENNDNDMIFRYITKDDALPAGDEYDDIVLWRTQDMIMAENDDSCAIP